MLCTGALQKTDDTMKKKDYLEILKQHLKTLDRKVTLGWFCQQSNDPKHTFRAVEKLLENKVKIFEVPSQNLVLK